MEKTAAQTPAAVPSASPPPPPRPDKPAVSTQTAQLDESPPPPPRPDKPAVSTQTAQLDESPPLLDTAMCETPRLASSVPTPPLVSASDVGVAKRKAVTPTSVQPAKIQPSASIRGRDFAAWSLAVSKIKGEYSKYLVGDTRHTASLPGGVIEGSFNRFPDGIEIGIHDTELGDGTFGLVATSRRVGLYRQGVLFREMHNNKSP
ncbi:cellulose-complementing protein-like [Gigantopelta aegis]|uniref:cellulose-complementing protein-like n=1 Tax=Gigantopelta aegis TaxID=1735272 RepID=UPI001B88CE4F|nr:cellulose-complementing protein-like [Gigantopelta aegis]